MTVARRILIQVAIGVVFVIAVATAVTYALVYDAMKRSGLRQLDTYVRERAEREEARFQEVETNLALVRGQFEKRLENPPSEPELAAFWNQWYERDKEGAWRSRKDFSDARKVSTLWIDSQWQDTPERRRDVMVGHRLCDELLPGWIDTFDSVYFTFKGLVNIGFDAEIPDWSNTMPAHYPTDGLEWVECAMPEKAPPKGCLWTGMQNDPAEPTPMVSIYLPIVRRGEVIGSVGHNMYMHHTLDLATQCNIAGAVHFIVREDGRLIAHSQYRDRIMSTAGALTAQGSGDRALASLYRACIAHKGEKRFADFDAGSDSYYSLARLAGPEWFFVTSLPQSQLRRQAFASAQWVLWSGLISLALVLAFIAAILRRQVTQPLAALAQATEAMGAGRHEVSLVAHRDDELGKLAGSFREMVEKVTLRENDLRQLNLELEKRVTARTAELNHALSLEREVGEMKSRFTSLVSHEFRTPLGVISSSAQILDRYLARLDDDERREHLENITVSVKRMAAMMEEMLVLSRMDSGRMDFKPTPLALGDLCRRLLDELRSAHGSVVHLEVAPEAENPAHADENLVRHILGNLLTNAHKYSPPGAPVWLTLARENGDAVFTVRDEGIGIPEADHARLFEAFHRGSNVGEVSGTGLGLVIVRRCCELHGGSVAVVSREGGGTTFTVRLPVFEIEPP